MTKALITGGHGFIGSHLVAYLKEKGITSLCLKHELLEHPQALRKTLQDYQPDYIFHLAAFGNMAHQRDIRPIFQSNTVGTFNLLEASVNLSYKAFINVGSSSEYGKKLKPMKEDMLPETDSFYGASKVANTYFAHAFAKHFTKPIVTVRPFSVYGPGEAQFRFIPTLIRHLENGTVMDIDEAAVHDWIYIDDLVEGMFTVSQHARELFGQVVNIGSGVMASNMEIENILCKMSGKMLYTNYFNNMRPNDSPLWVDGSKKLVAYGWKARTTLKKGLKRCYEHYKQRP